MWKIEHARTRWSTSIDGPSRTFEDGWPVYHCVDLHGYRLPASMMKKATASSQKQEPRTDD